MTVHNKRGPKTERNRLLEEYKNPETTDARANEIITRLYNLGYKVRPHGGEFRLMNRKTGEFIQE